MLLEVCLICIHHAVEPWEQFLCAMVSVQDNWDSVGWSDSANVFSCSNGTCNGSFLVAIFNTLTSHVRFGAV